MKKILFLLVLFVWGSVTFAQEIPEFKFFKIYGDLNGESVLLETPNPPKLVGVPGFVVEKERDNTLMTKQDAKIWVNASGLF